MVTMVKSEKDGTKVGVGPKGEKVILKKTTFAVDNKTKVGKKDKSTHGSGTHGSERGLGARGGAPVGGGKGKHTTASGSGNGIGTANSSPSPTKGGTSSGGLSSEKKSPRSNSVTRRKKKGGMLRDARELRERRSMSGAAGGAGGSGGGVAGSAAGGAGTKSKFENMLSAMDDYISRWRCGLDDLSSRALGETNRSNSVWQSKEKSKVYSGKGDAIKALLLRNRKAFLKPPEERTNEEIGEVHNLISQTLQTEFFSKYNKSIQKDMAAAMKMEHFKANEVVFLQGDQPGNSGKYYIIAYGRVRIQVEQMAQLDELNNDVNNPYNKAGNSGSPTASGVSAKKEETLAKKEEGGSHSHGHGHGGKHNKKLDGEKGDKDDGHSGGGSHGHDSSPTQGNNGISISKITTRRQRRKSTIVASDSQLLTELQTGEGFGELALLSDRARAASAICAEETVLLTLDKSSYLSLMKNEHQKTQEVNLGALSTLRLFRNCTRRHIESIAPYFVIQTHNRGTMFNPDKDDHVSFIMKGHAVVAYGVQRSTKHGAHGAKDMAPGGFVGLHAGVGASNSAVGLSGVGGGSVGLASGSVGGVGSHLSPDHGGMNHADLGVDKLTGLPLKKPSGAHGKVGSGSKASSKREHNLFVIRDLHEGDVFGETCVFQQFQRGYQIHAVTELEVLHISKVQFIDHIDEEVINHLREETAFRTSYYDGFYSLAQKRIEKRAEQLPELRDYLKDRAVLYNSVISKSRSVMEEYTSKKNFPLVVDKNGRRIHYNVRSYMIKT